MTTEAGQPLAVHYRADAKQPQNLYHVSEQHPEGAYIGVLFNPVNTAVVAAVMTAAANPGSFCCPAAAELAALRAIAVRNKRRYQDLAYAMHKVEEVLELALDPASSFHSPQTADLVSHIRAAMNAAVPRGEDR